MRTGDARLGGQRVIRGELDPRQAEPAGHDLCARALEDAELRVAVRVERVVAIQVIRLHVEQNRDVARKRLDILEGEARQLDDERCIRVDFVGDLAQRRVLVPCERRAAAGVLEDRAEQPCRRRLPLRAGDPDDGVSVQEAVAELDLAPEGKCAGPRSGDRRRARRDPGALDDELDTLQQDFLLVAEADFDAGRGKPARVGVGRAVGGDDRDAAMRERERGSAAGAAEPDHERAPRQPCLLGTCPAHKPRTPPWGVKRPLSER